MSEYSAYEQAIIEEMSEIKEISLQEAESVFLAYRPVLNRLQDVNESPVFFANEFFKANRKGFSPEAWIAHIDEIDAMIEQDAGERMRFALERILELSLEAPSSELLREIRAEAQKGLGTA